MPPRVVAFLLAIVLLWSGVAMTEQRFAFAASNPAQAENHAAAGEPQQAGFSGSIDDHQVDDQPVQPHAELLLDVAALLETAPGRPGLVLLASHPRPRADVILPPPCLEGPQRPPRAAHALFA